VARRTLSIRWLLLGANAFALLVPLGALGALRIYDMYLVRQTERQLIAQSTVIAETYRAEWMRARGVKVVPAFRPPGRQNDSLVPVQPVTELGFRGAPPQPQAQPGPAGLSATPAGRAGDRLTPLLKRAQVFNLTAVRLLDDRGCVVASTGAELGQCLGFLPEVRQALRGRYSAQARRREVPNPPPPLGSMSRRGHLLLFTALPVFSEGKVIGVVRLSRTSMDAVTSLWLNRRGLLLVALATLALTVLVSLLFAWTIAGPVRSITRAAQAIARGEPRRPLGGRGWLPAEIHALSQALDTMTRQLGDRADYIATFASNVSHELKTPLTGIRGAAELLREQWERMTGAQRERFLGNIDEDAARMERLVTRLLKLAKIQNAPEAAVEVDVADFFGELQARHPEQLQVRVHEGAPRQVNINPDHLASAVGNLVDNALRHGAGHPVQVEAQAAEGRLLVTVRDRGPGISEANRKRLFERFFTTERDRGGTGLGLAIVKAVADARDGSVCCDTGPDGTTFSVTL